MPEVRYLHLSLQVVMGDERNLILPAQSCGACSTFLVSPPPNLKCWSCAGIFEVLAVHLSEKPYT